MALNYTDSQIKEWFNAAPRGDYDIANRAADLNLNQADITRAIQVGMGGTPGSVSDWVGDQSHGYSWDNNGGLQHGLNKVNATQMQDAAPQRQQQAPPQYTRSPYLDQMFSAIDQQGTQNLNQNIMPNIRYGAQAAGGFGDTRQGIAEGNAIAQTQSAAAAQKAQAGQADYTNWQNNTLQRYGIDTNAGIARQQNQNSYNLGLGNLELGNRQADNNYSLGQGNLALGQTQANNNFSLGVGNLGLGAMQANNSYNLGMGNLGLGAQTANQNFYTNQRGQDLSAIGLGASLTNQGNQGNLGIGQGISGIGNTQQQAPWSVINNANGVFGPYIGQGQGTTQTQSGSAVGGAAGGALAGAQLSKLWGNSSNLGMGGSNWSTGGGQWNNPSAYNAP